MELLLNKNNIEIIKSFVSTKKERFDMILDPFQALYQIALLSYCPIGTKLSIDKNIVVIQKNNHSQGIIRWLSNDNKHDIFNLYMAFIRFKKFYGFLKEEHKDFFELIIKRVIIGIDNLRKTYQKSSNVTLLQTLLMFKNIINNESLSNELSRESSGIENLLIELVKIYDKKWLNIMENTLFLLNEDQSNYKYYLSGINRILTVKNKYIQQWFKENLTI